MTPPTSLACTTPHPVATHDSDGPACARGPRLLGKRELDLRERELDLDERELDETFARLRPRMSAVARRIVRSSDAAEDVVQNAFEKAVHKLSTFDGRSLLSTWLHRIVVNEALMWLRSETRRRRRFALASETGAEPERHPDPDGDPSRPLFAHEQIARLRAGLASLPPAERDVLEQCALAGESYDAYASRAGIGSAAAKSRAFRARQRLRDWLRHA